MLNEYIRFNHKYMFKKDKIDGFIFRINKNYNGYEELRFVVILNRNEYMVDKELVQTDALALGQEEQLEKYSSKWAQFMKKSKEI